MHKEEKLMLLRELYQNLEIELNNIKEERKRHSLMSFKGQKLSWKIPGIIIAQTHINRMMRKIRGESK